MERWKTFLDSLNTPGGHIFVLSAFFCLLMLLTTFHDPNLKELTMIFVGALGNEMRGQIPNSVGQTTTITSKDSTNEGVIDGKR